jgi:hypothetical protein
MALTGAELLQKIQALGDAPRDQVAIACGYVNDKTGKPAFTAFYEAMLVAKGLQLAPPSTAKAKSRGKAPSYEATIAKTGTLPIGASYTSEAGWAAADKVRITVAGGRIILDRITPAAAPSSPSEAVVTPAAPVSAASPSAGAPEAALAPF